MRRKTKRKKKRSFPTAVEKKSKEPQKKEAVDWPEFRNLSDENLEKKLGDLPEQEMISLYMKLEKEMNFRIDPVNYRRPRIIKNFMLLWHSKIEREKKPEVKDEAFRPLTDEEGSKIFKP